MYKSDYQFWIDYHNGKIKRKLTKKEIKEIRASDFAMHILVPTKCLLELCGGYENLEQIYINSYNHNYNYNIKKIAEKLEVQEEVVLFKMQYIIINHKKAFNKNNNKKRRKILNRKNNIIYVDFK